MLHTFRSARGSSMVELMVATTVLSVAMACTYGSVATQMRTHATQTMVTESMNETRMALRILADQVDMAGFGVPSATTPSAAPKLITASPSQLSFWTKSNAGHTYLTAAAVQSSTSMTVLSAVAMTPGASFYVTDTARWYFGTVQQVVGNTVTTAPLLTFAFAPGSLVTPVERVTFQLVGDQLQRNGHTVIRNVTALGFTYDSTSASAVRQIGILLSAQTLAVDPATQRRLVLTQTASVSPPNLGM